MVTRGWELGYLLQCNAKHVKWIKSQSKISQKAL